MQVLLAVAWTLAALDAIFVVVLTILACSSNQDSAGRGMASGLALGCAIAVGMAALILFGGRSNSMVAVCIAIVGLVFPLLVVGAPLLEQARKRKEEQHELAKRGKFANPDLAALAGAVDTNNPEAFTSILQRAHNLEDRDASGETLLGYAVKSALEKRGSFSSIRVLLDAGANPNPPAFGDEPAVFQQVFEAESPISNDLFKLLLDRKADPNTRDSFGAPMLHRSKGQLLKLKLLVDCHADLNATSQAYYRNGWTAVMSLAMDGAYDEALYLVQRGADVQHVAPDGETLSSVLERRDAIAAESGETLPASYRSLANAVRVHARRW